jgi:hypothetical protein
MTKEQTRDMALCAKGKMLCENCSNKTAQTVKGVTCGIPEKDRTIIKAKLDKENKRIKKTEYTLKAKRKL